MKKSYVKSRKEYGRSFELDSSKILLAMTGYKITPKRPINVSLDENTITELKAAAEKQGIPYQALIRVFILDGLERIKKAA